MIVSALLTSLGINVALCFLFFTLYAVLRKKPENYTVYVPLLLKEGYSRWIGDLNLERLFPIPDWVKSAWQPSEEEILSSSGLDAVVFLRIIIFSLKVFAVAGIIGLFILLPVNCLGNQIQQIDLADITNDSLDVFSISNVNNGSNWLWIHFSAVYVFTVIVCYLLYQEYKYLSSKRLGYFESSKPQPHHFTVLVRNIPVSVGSRISDSVDSFFSKYHPTTYLSHMVVHRTSKIQGLIDDAKHLYKMLASLRRQRNRSKFKRDGLFGLFGRKYNIVDQYEKKLEDIETNVRLEQSDLSLAGKKEVRAAFVSFKSRVGAAIAIRMQQSDNPTQWLTEQAPAPQDVYWPVFHSSFMRRWMSKLAVIFAVFLLTVSFLIPVLIVQGLTNLAQLEAYFPSLKSILDTDFVSKVVTGYLPNLILLLFLKTIPPIMFLLSSIQGHVAHSEIEKSACYKVVWFTVWNVFFANVLSGSVINQISVFLEPKDIPSKLAVVVPAQASFFIAYVVTSGWTSIATEVFRLIPLVFSLIRRAFSTEHNAEIPSFPYHRDLPKILFFGLVGIVYFFLAPLILPFLLVYFALAYIVYRNQIINVYASTYETGGKFWPIAFNSVIFSLVLMHLIAVGIFTLKKLSLASTLVFPLPILTLLFNEYCRNRFLPISISYSLESLMKKDIEDQSDASMVEFFEKLGTAYMDPALLPIKYSSSSNSQKAPLLSNYAA